MLKRCQLTFRQQTHHMPKYPLADGLLAKDYLRQLCEEGLKKRVQEYTQYIQNDYL